MVVVVVVELANLPRYMRPELCWIEVVGVMVLVVRVVELTRVHETLAFLDRGGGRGGS